MLAKEFVHDLLERFRLRPTPMMKSGPHKRLKAIPNQKANRLKIISSSRYFAVFQLSNRNTDHNAAQHKSSVQIFKFKI